MRTYNLFSQADSSSGWADTPHCAWLIAVIPIPFWLLAAALNSERLAHTAAFLGLSLACRWWFSLIGNSRGMLAMLKIGSTSLLTIMSLTWLISAYYNISVLGQPVSATLELEIEVALPDYCFAVAFVLAFAGVLAAFGETSWICLLERRAADGLMRLSEGSLRQIYVLILAVTTIEAILILSGTVSYRTFLTEGVESGRVAWFIPILEYMFAGHIGLNALALSLLARDDQPRARRRTVLLVVLSFATVSFIFFTKGRSLFLMAAFFHFYWFTFFFGRRPQLSRMIVVLLLVSPFMYSATLFNNFMRSASADVADLYSVNILSSLATTIDLWNVDSSARQLESARSAENMASRPLVANPLAKSIALPDAQKRFLYGENLFNSLIWSIPQIVAPDKANFPIMEELLYANFPIGSEDIADSPYLYAYVDFGYFGILIYPAIISAIWAGILLLMTFVFSSPWSILFIACSSIWPFTIYLGEAAMTSWFTHVRSTLLVTPIMFLLSKLAFQPSAARWGLPPAPEWWTDV